VVRQIRRWDSTKVTAALAWSMIALYILFFGYVTVAKHNAFQTTAFDLGNVDQAVWNTRHGRPLAMTNIEGLTNRLGTHVEPILLPISLLYFIWSDPRCLLVLQTVVIALGAWPVYQLVRWKTCQSVTKDWGWQRDFLALVLAVAYLLFPALQSANTFDFHAVALAPSLFLFALYCLETERWGRFALLALLTLSCKEDMPLLVAMLGVYALVAGRDRKWRVALSTVTVAGIWFIAAVGWVIPHFDTRGVSPLAARYAYLGDDPLEMVLTLVSRPDLALGQLRASDSLVYVRDLLTPVAFLSLLAPQALLLAVPPLAVNLLSTDGNMHQLEEFHYGATLAPIVVIAAGYGAAWLMRRFPGLRYLPSLLAIIVLVSTLLYQRGHGYTPLAAGFRGSWPTVTEHERVGEQIARSIPTEASLAALPHPNPHASQRQQLYMIDHVDNGYLAPLHDADYVWLDVTDSWPVHPNDLKLGVDNLLADGYGVDQAIDGWLLLRRGAPNKTPGDAFYSFARRSAPQPEYPMLIQFDEGLRLLGFDLVHEDSMINISLYWRADDPLGRDYRIYPFFYDDEGAIIEDTSLRPMTTAIWYPTSHWKRGETVWMQTLPWDVGGDFYIGLGVMDGEDWTDQRQRLAARIVSSSLRVRLFDQGTAIQLAEVRGGKVTTPKRIYALPDSAHPMEYHLGEQVRLVGYEVVPESPTKDEAVVVRLYWQADGEVSGDFTVFAHLVGTDERIVAQHDGQPDEGRHPTSHWVEGEIIEDEHVLVPATGYGPGDYSLFAGMYDLESGERLPVYDQNGQPMPQGRAALAGLHVEE
jgi:uncharacterized membrane protein